MSGGFPSLCSENRISWIFGLFFENVHEWKQHHWNLQEPRTRCIGMVPFDKYQLFPNVPPGLRQLQPVCKPTKWLAFWPWLAFCSDGSLGNPRNCFLRTPVVLNREKSGCHIAMILGKKESNAMQCNHAEQHYIQCIAIWVCNTGR